MRPRSGIPFSLQRTHIALYLAAGAALVTLVSCGGRASETIEHPAPFISNFSTTTPYVTSGGNGSLLANFAVSNGSATVTPGNLAIQSNVPLTVGPLTTTTTYTLTVTSGNGKVATSTVTINVPAAPVATLTTSADATGKITKDVTGYTATVPSQNGATYTWSTTNCTITGGSGTNQVTFTAGSTLGAANITCQVRNQANQTASGTKALTVVDVPPTALTYSANPASYYQTISITPNNPAYTGGAVTDFSVLPALPAGLQLNALTGQITGTPTATASAATYVVTATNSGGATSVNLVLTVLPQPSVNFSAAAGTIAPGGGTSLLWNIDSSVASVMITGTDGSSYGPFTASGTRAIAPAADTTYTLVATLTGGGTYTATPVTVRIDTTPLAISNFVGTPAVRGGNSNLTWTLSGMPLTQALDGNPLATSTRNATVSPKGRQTFTLNAANGATSATATATVAASGLYHFAGSYGSGRGNVDGGVDDNGFSMGRFYRPNAIVWDEKANDGTIIVADYSNNLVRRVTPDRVVRTIAGTPGLGGTASDNTTLTKLLQPRNTAVDPVTGDIYLGGEGFTTKRLLKLSPVGDGTYAPSLVPGFTFNTNALVIDANQVMYFVTFDTGLLFSMDLKSTTPTAVQIANISATMGTNSATAMAKDFNGGRRLLYVVGTNRVVKIDLAPGTPTATLFAGTGTAGFQDNPLATSGTLSGPQGATVDTSGNVYIADRNNYAVRMVPTSGPLAGALITIAGKTGTAGEGYASSSITITNAIPTSTTNCLSNVYYVLAQGNGGDGTKIFVADAGASFDNQSIRVIDVTSPAVGSLTYTLDDPAKPAGYAYAGAPRVTGATDGQGVNAKFNFGTTSGANLATLPDGSLTFAADTANNLVRVIKGDATVSTLKDASTANFTFTLPKCVAVQVSGTGALAALFVADAAATKKIRRFTPNGDDTFTEDTSFTITGGTFPTSVDALGMVVDSASTGILYVAEGTANKIFKVDLATKTSTDFVAATGSKPMGLALQNDASGKYLWSAVYTANQVKKYDMSGGLVLTVGSGTAGWTDGTATAATLTSPTGIAVDGNGKVYVNSFASSTTSTQNGIRVIETGTGATTTLLGYATSTTSATFFGVKAGLFNPNNSSGTDAARSLNGAVIYAPQGLTVNAAGDLLLSTPHSLYKVVAPAGM